MVTGVVTAKIVELAKSGTIEGQARLERPMSAQQVVNIQLYALGVRRGSVGDLHTTGLNNLLDLHVVNDHPVTGYP